MILDQFVLNGKIALITGANDGIGQGMTVALAEAGADIAAVYRSDITETERLVTSLGRRFYPIKVDLSKKESVDVVFNSTTAYFGRIDILFNNAGVILRDDAVDVTDVDWDAVIDVNLNNLFFLTQKVGRYMIKEKIHGKIVNTASLLSFQGGARVPAYTASKSAVKGITMALANEWAKFGINVNAIAPGYIMTKITKALWNDPVAGAKILERIPAGRWGTPEDFKGIAVFLASAASDYINGYTIAVDGGWLGR